MGMQGAIAVAALTAVVCAVPAAAEWGQGPLYPANREPLRQTRFQKLPIGSVAPRGWLRQMLTLEAAGMSGRLTEISPWCRFEGNAWSDPHGAGHSGWEELPYWLKGYGDLGYVLRDPRIIQETRRWIEAVLAGQEPDGWFGPSGLKTSLDGKPDLWPHMVMLNALQSYYEYSGDKRVLSFMRAYFKWELNCPEDRFLTGFWPRMRGGDNLESIYWLYNRTGEAWLLDLARKVHAHTADWSGGVANWHGVNICQGFREPAIYYLQAKEQKYLQAAERNYSTVRGIYGQVPGGLFGADENCRPGYTDPRQGTETCSMVEFMHSAQLLTRVSGDPVWSDRCEDVAFNSFPAALTADMKALHYLTAPNQVQLDKGNKAPGIQNKGMMFAYSPGAAYRCCQHNVAYGWPYYAEEMWLATADRGLCASLYAPSEVTARVGEGATVRITEETEYPFGDTVTFRVSLNGTASFPLLLRIPGWCREASVQVNGKRVAGAHALSYATVNREWRDGDTVTLRLPMSLAVRTWEKNHNSVSVERGPLTFSLQIGERWVRDGGSEAWPDWNVYPATPWNYGLALDAKHPASSFTVVSRPGPLPAQPFTPENAPLSLRVAARRIPAWTQDNQGLVNTLQQSPARSTEPLETVTLIPMGCARLRISAFPTVSEGEDAHEWAEPAHPAIAASASHCFENDTVNALSDGMEPANSNDQAIPRFTWWDHRGGTEWAQYDFAKARTVSAVSVYWFDDRGVGQCRVPQSWRLLYRDGDAWKPVASRDHYGDKRDAYNRVRFTPVVTTGLRLEVQLQPGFSGGILEWRVEK